MFNRLRNGYRKVRYLPRYIVTTLREIAENVSALRQQREAGWLRTSASLGEMHSDIESFFDDSAKAIIRLQSSLETATAQIAVLDRRARASETALRAEISQQVSQVAAQFAALDSNVNALKDTVQRGVADEVGTARRKLADEVTASRRAIADAVADMRTELAQQAEQLRALPECIDRQAERIDQQTDRIDRQSSLIDRQTARIEHLGMVVAEQARIFPSWAWTQESAAHVRDILALLNPMAVPDVAKLRVGRDWDGGYVMLDDFDGIAAALSLGIADDVSWDMHMAERGIQVLQFDPTVVAPPEAHDLFRFASVRVAAEDADGAVSLDSIVRTCVDDQAAPLLLKIDIEGDEWPVFAATSAQVLGRFKQIVCEFHTLDRLAEDSFAEAARAVFGKLARTHFVHHVHGNNCSNFVNVANVILPQTLEVSFARRADYAHMDSAGLFPTALDQPNQPGRADLFLGSFKF